MQAENVEKVQTLAKAVYPEEPEFKNYDETFNYNRTLREKLTAEFSAAYQDFAVNTTSELFNGSEENIIYSPLSLYYALALAADGAEGETKAEMLDLLGYGDVESLASDCKNSFEVLYHVTNEANDKPSEYGEYPSESRYKLVIANSIWADDGIDVKKEFAERGAEYYYADLFTGDLQSEHVAEAKADWVRERTEGLISPEEKPAGGQTVLSILNTVYFYDEWINRFEEEKTEE